VTTVRVTPGPVHGRIRAPSSKSYTHRALVVGHLSRHLFRVLYPLDSDDTRATASAIARLGSSVLRGRRVWRLTPNPPRRSRAPARINCRESGTTLRFTVALGSLSGRRVVIGGTGRLAARPIDPLLRALEQLGATCRHPRGRGLPLEVLGPIRPGRVTVAASESSQFTSALLCVLPTLEGDSILEVTGKVVSQPYVDATVAVLARFRVQVDRRGRRYHVPGRQRFRGNQFAVPGDASSAAYLWASALIAGGSVRVDGIDPRWPQADLAVLDLLESAGATVQKQASSVEVSSGPRTPFRVDLTNAPDLYPLAGVLAATTPGVSHIFGAEHVALKESDRKVGTIVLARRLGARVEETRHVLTIRGTARPHPLDLPNLSDHRLVMSAAVAALGAEAPSRIGERGAVRKSYPAFWTALSSLSHGGVGR
jgi:3-phosphoshikimate 1-carboxyvinyltransferase